MDSCRRCRLAREEGCQQWRKEKNERLKKSGLSRTRGDNVDNRSETLHSNGLPGRRNRSQNTSRTIEGAGFIELTYWQASSFRTCRRCRRPFRRQRRQIGSDIARRTRIPPPLAAVLPSRLVSPPTGKKRKLARGRLSLCLMIARDRQYGRRETEICLSLRACEATLATT
jgi:hypothetical protein